MVISSSPPSVLTASNPEMPFCCVVGLTVILSPELVVLNVSYPPPPSIEVVMVVVDAFTVLFEFPS